jgi:hypothetical protein
MRGILIARGGATPVDEPDVAVIRSLGELPSLLAES